MRPETAPDRDGKCVAMLVSGSFETAGGIGRWAGYLAQAWSEQGLSPPLEIIETRADGHLRRTAAAFARALLRLVQLRARGRLGVIHANLSVRGSTGRKLIVAQIARALGVPLVIHLHGSGYHQFYAGLPRLMQGMVRAMFLEASEIIVLGAFWADWVATTLDVPRSRISILYNGVRQPTEPRPDRAGQPTHIVLLGRIGARKGVPELLDALASDIMRGRDWMATLAGDGELETFRAAVAARGLAGRVTFPGWLDVGAAARLQASADILVLPSHAENSPISIIEALAAEVAVVATPVGTTPELLTDGESALFVPVGDAPALADALARLVDDRALRNRIAAAGHRVFRDKLDIDQLARALADRHARIMAGQPPAVAARPPPRGQSAGGGPTVSVIIPTTRRPDLVGRAVRSVLAQTMADLEVIVVVDGPNPETIATLSGIEDKRLRVLQNAHPAGAGAARNLGAAQGQGAWLAFLDDDDEWLPEKLERQLAFAGDDEVLVSCRSRVVTPHATYVWPSRPYDGRMPIDDYLFDRKTLFRGASLLQTSSYLLPRRLFERTQFGTSRQNEDTTLLLRVTKQAGARIVMTPETLVVLHAEQARESLGSSYDWREMLAWADSSRALLTKRAYSGFCLIYLGSQAARHADYAGFPLLLWRAVSRGRPTLAQLLPFLAFWVLPIGLRRRIRALIRFDRNLVAVKQ